MKKFLIISAVIGGAIAYANTHMTPEKVVAYAYTVKDPKLQARLVFYAGRYQLYKGRNRDVMASWEPFLQRAEDNNLENAYKSEMHYYLGEAHEGEREWVKARENYELYLTEAPTGEHADLTRQKMELLRGH